MGFWVPADLWCFVVSGYKIPVLENLGATLDQFDTIDLSDNEVRKLDGFPLLKRLKTVLMNNNRIWWVLWVLWVLEEPCGLQ